MRYREFTDAETAAYLRQWVQDNPSGVAFGWPTDGCGKEQHLRFVHHRNANWTTGTWAEYVAFILAYADSLDGVAVAPAAEFCVSPEVQAMADAFEAEIERQKDAWLRVMA